jgi:hypothetical protein
VPGLTADAIDPHFMPPAKPSWWSRIISIFTGGPAMANPTECTASFDKATYAPGEEMTLTASAVGQNTTGKGVTATVVFTDSVVPAATASAQATATVQYPNALESSVTDNDGRDYNAEAPTQTGQDFGQVFTTTA